MSRYEGSVGDPNYRINYRFIILSFIWKTKFDLYNLILYELLSKFKGEYVNKDGVLRYYLWTCFGHVPCISNRTLQSTKWEKLQITSKKMSLYTTWFFSSLSWNVHQSSKVKCITYFLDSTCLIYQHITKNFRFVFCPFTGIENCLMTKKDSIKVEVDPKSIDNQNSHATQTFIIF